MAGLLFVAMFILNMFNQGTRGGGDSYMHYLFAHWSFVHPKLFFDHWGKPLFTILSSPFAQLGFKGAVTFNIIAGIASGVLVALTAKKMGAKFSWLGILMTVFTPLFFVISFSSLTEILFAFTLVLAIYLFVTQNYQWSAIVISFIPFARTEGVIFLPLFALGLAKNYKSIWFLLTGFVIMSVIGYPVHKDLLWTITKNPYHGSTSIYGSGDPFHFFMEAPAIFGWPLIISFVLGVVAMVLTFYKQKNGQFAVHAILILGCSLGYFLAHSLVWAFGIGASAGLTRVMAGIVPLLALTGLFGLSYFLESIKWSGTTRVWVLTVLALVFVIEGTTKNKFPLELKKMDQTVIDACQFIRNENLDQEFIVYYNPLEAYTLKLDPFSTERSRERVLDNTLPSKDLSAGSVIIWDSQFGPVEGGLAKEVLLNDSELNLLKAFIAPNEFNGTDNFDFEVLIFQKRP